MATARFLTTGLAAAISLCSACVGADDDWATDSYALADVKHEVKPGTAVARASAMFTPADSGGHHGCSATIIDDSHALTAGHCTFGLEDVDNAVLMFSTRFADDAPMRHVVDWFTPEESPFEKDIAVLEFEGGLPEGVEPVGLAPNLVMKANDPIIMAGYGILSVEEDGRGTLRQSLGAFVKKQPGEPDRYRSKDGVLCSGDSGGPDFVIAGGELRQLGVHVSGNCEALGVSTNVLKYVDFIESTGATPELDLETTKVDPPGPPNADCIDGCAEPTEPAAGCSAAGGGGASAAWLLLALFVGARRRVRRPLATTSRT